MDVYVVLRGSILIENSGVWRNKTLSTDAARSGLAHPDNFGRLDGLPVPRLELLEDQLLV